MVAGLLWVRFEGFGGVLCVFVVVVLILALPFDNFNNAVIQFMLNQH